MPQTILVLGGGVGGLVAANRLRRALPREHRVMLVEREASHVFAPSLLWLLVGARTLPGISRPLNRLKRKGIEVVRIITLGAELAPEAVPGLSEAGLTFYTAVGAEALRDAFAAFRSGRLAILTAAPAYKCPAAPYEAAMLLEDGLRRRGLRGRTQIDLYAAEAGPLGVAGPEVSRSVRAMVEAKGTRYHPEHQVVHVDPRTHRLSFSNGAEAEYDLLAYIPPHRAPRIVRDAGLTDDSRWVSVDRHTLATRFEKVPAMSDSSARVRNGRSEYARGHPLRWSRFFSGGSGL